MTYLHTAQHQQTSQHAAGVYDSPSALLCQSTAAEQSPELCWLGWDGWVRVLHNKSTCRGDHNRHNKT
ncbi:MAG: hypothetical protein PVG66_04305 [Chromatiales bacterium]|jgi:hypothetical protein